MITNSKHNTNNEPKTKGENTHAELCTEAMDTGANSEMCKMLGLRGWTMLQLVHHYLQKEHSGFLFYIIQLYINSGSLYTVFTCATITI